MDIPPELQDKLAQFQTIQQQLQLISIQKQQLLVQKTETENALIELGKLSGGEKIFKATGMLLIESSKKESEKCLGEEKELSETRVKVLEKQEKKLTEKYDEMRTQIQAMISQKKDAG